MSVCRKCDRRKPGCHSNCEAYKAEQERNKETLERRRLDCICRGVWVKRKG